MPILMRTPATAVWALLVSATALSWALGTSHGVAPSAHELASVAILTLAFVKVRFIGLYFMELRRAPIALRGIFEAYCVVVGLLVIVMFVSAG